MQLDCKLNIQSFFLLYSITSNFLHRHLSPALCTSLASARTLMYGPAHSFALFKVGYKYKFREELIDIPPNGKLGNPPRGFFDTEMFQLAELFQLRRKQNEKNN